MMHKVVNIDVYDADSHFLYCTAKLPMYDLLRQQRPRVDRAKRIEATAPDGPDYRAELKVLISHEGHMEKEYFNESKEERAMRSMAQETGMGQRKERIQPTQSKAMRVVKSKPIDTSRVAQTSAVLNNLELNSSSYNMTN